MAKQDDEKMRGLLFSPEVLGGFGLLSAGLAGKNPSQAFPSMFQGLQTAQLYSKYLTDQKATDAVNKLISSGELSETDKTLLAVDRGAFVKSKLSTKKPTFETFKKGTDVRTINTSSAAGLAEATNLVNNGYTKFTQSVQGSNLGSLSKGTVTGAEKKVIGASDLLSKLNVMDQQFEPGFLTYGGKAIAFGTEQAQKLGLNTPEKFAQFLARKSEWQLANQQFFNNYRKEITGVAAGEKEIGFLKESIPNIDDAPGVYKAKVKLQIKFTKDLIKRNKEFLATGLQPTRNEKGEPIGKYKEYLKNNPIKLTRDDVLPIAQQFQNMGFSKEIMIFKLNNTFGKGNWEKFFEKK